MGYGDTVARDRADWQPVCLNVASTVLGYPEQPGMTGQSARGAMWLADESPAAASVNSAVAPATQQAAERARALAAWSASLVASAFALALIGRRLRERAARTVPLAVEMP